MLQKGELRSSALLSARSTPLRSRTGACPSLSLKLLSSCPCQPSPSRRPLDRLCFLRSYFQRLNRLTYIYILWSLENKRVVSLQICFKIMISPKKDSSRNHKLQLNDVSDMKRKTEHSFSHKSIGDDPSTTPRTRAEGVASF